MTTLIYTHEACLDHKPGPHHPESPARLEAVLQALKTPEFSGAVWRDAPLGSFDQVLHVHTPDYVDQVQDASPTEGYRALDAGDTILSPGSLEAVMRCVGAACAGVDDVVAGEAANVFCATRPCGHHAEADQAMGFCVFNQAAIAALHAREHALEKAYRVDDARPLVQHHAFGTTAHGGIGDLGPRRRARLRHLLQYLRRPDHRHVRRLAQPQDLLLQFGEALVADLDRKIATGDHHAQCR